LPHGKVVEFVWLVAVEGISLPSLSHVLEYPEHVLDHGIEFEIHVDEKLENLAANLWVIVLGMKEDGRLVRRRAERVDRRIERVCPQSGSEVREGVGDQSLVRDADLAEHEEPHGIGVIEAAAALGAEQHSIARFVNEKPLGLAVSDSIPALLDDVVALEFLDDERLRRRAADVVGIIKRARVRPSTRTILVSIWAV
jgi:hypothetical protein